MNSFHNNPSGWAFVLSLEKQVSLRYYLTGLDSCPGASQLV